MRKRQRTLSITHKFGNRAWNWVRHPLTVILNGVFGVKDLTRPDRGNPNESVGGGCQRAFTPLKREGRLLRESPGIFVRFAVCCEVLHSADFVQDDKLLCAGSFLNTRVEKMRKTESLLRCFRKQTIPDFSRRGSYRREGNRDCSPSLINSQNPGFPASVRSSSTIGKFVRNRKSRMVFL